jgi:hypothetical protein
MPVEQDRLSDAAWNFTSTGSNSLTAGFHAMFRQPMGLVMYFLVEALLVPLFSLQATFGSRPPCRARCGSAQGHL